MILMHLSLALFCLVLSVDAIDMSGKHEVDLHTNIWKVRFLFEILFLVCSSVLIKCQHLVSLFFMSCETLHV
jgi:hypothetical protein